MFQLSASNGPFNVSIKWEWQAFSLPNRFTARPAHLRIATQSTVFGIVRHG